MMSQPSRQRLRTAAVVGSLMLSMFAGACGGTPSRSAGSWIGDAKRVDGADRIEMTVDSSGTMARIILAAWQVDTVTASRVRATGDSLVFVAVVQKDTLRLTAAHVDDKLHGVISLGERHAEIEMVHLFVLRDAEQRAMVGTYRTDSGRVIGIAPFSEFGARLMVIDYETGRIGPLYPGATSGSLGARSSRPRSPPIR